MQRNGRLGHDAVMYAEVTHLAGLSNAVSSEKLESWEFKLPVRKDGEPRGILKVSRTTKGRVDRYRETLRYPVGDQNHKERYLEHVIAITKEYFEGWITAFGNVKEVSTTYVFILKDVPIDAVGETVVIPEVKYIVDVYADVNNRGQVWCKITADLVPVFEFLESYYPGNTGIKEESLFWYLPFKPVPIPPAKPLVEKTPKRGAMLWSTDDQALV